VGCTSSFEGDVGGVVITTMKIDNIIEIEVDSEGRLRIYPEKERFVLIWHTATEVHWANTGLFLYSPKPREWTYLDWYKHILNVVSDCNCKLILSDRTYFENVPDDLIQDILSIK